MSRSFPILALCLLTGVCAVPVRTAQAGISLAASIGLGGELSPVHQYEATNFMLAPGIDFMGIIRLELGVLGSLAAVRAHTTNTLDLELRPMLVLSAPIIPLYLRVIVAGVNLFSPQRTVAYGGALGVGASVLGLGVFAEAGVLPRYVAPSFIWLLEGRAGIRYSF